MSWQSMRGWSKAAPRRPPRGARSQTAFGSNRGGSLCAFGLGADEGDAQHVGRARRAERNAGDDDDALARPGEAVAERQLAGAVDHVVLVVRVLGDDAVHAPY